MSKLSRELRLSIAAFAFSIAGTSIATGNLAFIAGLAGIGAIFVPLINLLDQVLDFGGPLLASRLAAANPLTWLVLAEALEAVVSALTAVIVAVTGPTIVTLLVFAAMTGITAFIIDITGEVFVATAAAGRVEDLLRINTLISTISLAVGSIASRSGGALLTGVALWLPFAVNAGLSAIAAAIRLDARTHVEAKDAEHDDSGSPRTDPAETEHTSWPFVAVSMLIAAIPAYWSGFIVLRFGQSHDRVLAALFFAIVAIGQLVGAQFPQRIGKRVTPSQAFAVGVSMCLLGTALVCTSVDALIVAGAGLAYAGVSACLVVSFTMRQAVFRGAGLVKLASRCRIAASFGALASSAVGYYVFSTGITASGGLSFATAVGLGLLSRLTKWSDLHADQAAVPSVA